MVKLIQPPTLALGPKMLLKSHQTPLRHRRRTTPQKPQTNRPKQTICASSSERSRKGAPSKRWCSCARRRSSSTPACPSSKPWSPHVVPHGGAKPRRVNDTQMCTKNSSGQTPEFLCLSPACPRLGFSIDHYNDIRYIVQYIYMMCYLVGK